MTSTLYSTHCYISNNLYRLSICVDNNEQNSTGTQLTMNSLGVISSDIPTNIIPSSLTLLNFELVSKRTNIFIPKTIILNHLVNIQRKTSQSNQNNRYADSSSDKRKGHSTTILTMEQSGEASSTALNTNFSEPVNSQMPKVYLRDSFRWLFSAQSHADRETNLILNSLIELKYVDASNSVQWKMKSLKLEFETEDGANDLYNNLNLCLATLKQRPHHLLVFVNPFSGKGQARFMYERNILPIFKEANITVKSIYTERADHAREYVIHQDLSDYDGLVCVGGDGIFAELYNGLLLRKASDEQLNMDDPQVKLVRPNLRIGIIPAGSTDAVVYSTTGLRDAITSTLQIVIGESLSIDIATIHNERGFVCFMATMVAYGFFGDIIYQSDKWRRLGPLRYDFSGFCQFIRNKSYRSEITMIVLPDDPTHAAHLRSNKSVDDANSEVETSIPSESDQLLGNTSQKPNRNTRNSLKTLQKIAAPFFAVCKKNCERCARKESCDRTNLDLPFEMKREGRYTMINCLNMPCRCAKSAFGISPYVHLGDGALDLVLVKRSWRTGFLRFLWQIANDSRSIEDLPNVERYCVSEVLIRPMNNDRKRLGNWACDGELISGNEIRVRTHRQALTLFASGIQLNQVEEDDLIKKRRCSACYISS